MSTAPPVPRSSLTLEQEGAIAALLDGLRERKPVQTLGGFAGTGKTTIIRHLKEHLPCFAVCAFTGKAASVLRRKGVEASTIHSLVYVASEDPLTRKVVFQLRDVLPCTGVIVDEASMVSRDIFDDLVGFGLPLIFVGDHGQLEPVGSDFNLMANPDIRLETIHRNAGEISRFAEWVRLGRDATRFPLEATRQVEFVRGRQAEDLVYREGIDQIIVAFNRTRCGINALVRERLGCSGCLLQEGERVMCLRNNRDLGLFNGLQGEVLGYSGGRGRSTIDISANGRAYYGIPINPAQFGADRTLPPEDRYDDRMPFDYAYAITCHKAQGDEFGTVMVLEQRCSHWDHRRWAYTAASRARDKVIWVRGF